MNKGFDRQSTWSIHRPRLVAVLALLTALAAGNTAQAGVGVEAVAGDGSSTPAEPVPLLDPTALQALVGPIALYPDDLLAIALPAATYPLQVVQASRFLKLRGEEPSLQPSQEWDDSVVALLNYPEVVELLNDDLDWTWKLGEAVLAQQEDVLEAVAAFRERARLAGNLRSDDFQVVENADEGIRIRPRDPEVVYVPYYEPSRVTVYHPRPVYHYYPARYPLYYYPYAPGHRFASGFWGVTSAFSIGWTTRRLHVHYVTYRDHPYYGHHYYDRYFYRRPPSFRIDDGWGWYGGPADLGRHHSGNYWHPGAHRHCPNPRHDHRHRHSDGEQDSGREAHRGSRRGGRLVARGSVVNGIAVPGSAAMVAARQAGERRTLLPGEAKQAEARARVAVSSLGAVARAQRNAAPPAARVSARQTRWQPRSGISPSRPTLAQPSRPAPAARIARPSRPAAAPRFSLSPRPSPASRGARPAFKPGTVPRLVRTTPMQLD
ncbi:MAG: DUF3300 domain-containing protein [Pseudomonadales bacterium]|nr:DUF3300 domain-containing protein [Pseudomonadales bacterium]NIX08867.1 DUF3300 domain-containing protein [Pseudomonadales bacterium]